ncbi:hypothetical protein Dimus_022992 [Dionaea muscipula]
MTLASILEVPGNNGLCTYIKEISEESKYRHPLEITRKFSHDDTITKARRAKSIEMKPYNRLLHIFAMRNVLSRFGKRDTVSFMDLTYKDYLLTGKKGEEGDKATNEGPSAPITQQDVQKKGKSKTRRVDPSSTISDSDFLHLQAELYRALKANT